MAECQHNFYFNQVLQTQQFAQKAADTAAGRVEQAKEVDTAN